MENEKPLTNQELTRQVVEKQMLDMKLEFHASGAKSSEGDGRTAADIEQELLDNGS